MENAAIGSLRSETGLLLFFCLAKKDEEEMGLPDKVLKKIGQNGTQWHFEKRWRFSWYHGTFRAKN